MSVEDVLMFATGLTSLPPSGLEPLPRIEFLDDSPFPMANTCSNILKLPLLDNKWTLDFIILQDLAVYKPCDWMTPRVQTLKRLFVLVVKGAV